MTQTDKILEKIALLLRKAESTTPQEAEALTEHAERLMVRHGIERARAEAAALGRDRKAEEIVTIEMDVPSGAYGDAYASVTLAIANAYGAVRVYIFTRRTDEAKSKTVRIVGYQSDAESVRTLATSLLLQGRVALDAWWRFERENYGRIAPATAGSWRRAYLRGFGSGAAEKLKNMRLKVVAEEETSTPGTELMLVDRKAAVDIAYDDIAASLGLRMGRSVRVSPRAMNAGRRDGSNANVGGGTLAGSRRALGR
jgi:hypothetical protein